MGAVNSHMGARWTFGSRMPRAGSPAIAAYFRDYYDKVLLVDPENLIGYWTLSEPTGATTAEDESGQDNTGTYSNVTLEADGISDGLTGASFNGNSSYVNIYSAALNSDFDGAEGALLIWGRVANANVWTDSTERVLAKLAADADNLVRLYRSSTNNTLGWEYKAGGTSKIVTLGSLSDTEYMQLLITWSVAADEVRAYRNGVQVGTTQTGLGTWAGSLSATLCALGAANTTPENVWNGLLAHAALWTAPLDEAEADYLAAP